MNRFLNKVTDFLMWYNEFDNKIYKNVKYNIPNFLTSCPPLKQIVLGGFDFSEIIAGVLKINR
jgi:hypothetical protein